jgi:hypothetical protein
MMISSHKVLVSSLFFTACLNVSFGQACDNLQIPSGTILITSDTTFTCGNPTQDFLVCAGVTVNFTDNSCFNTFYLEPGATIIFDSLTSYGYSTVYAQSGSTVDANFTQIMNLYVEPGSAIIDTSSVPPVSPMNWYDCTTMSFDYSLSGSCPVTSDGCTDIQVPAGTYVITSDTTFNCGSPTANFLVCSGVTVNFTDNSCFNGFYLEPGATLIYDSLTSYGYSTVYAPAGATVDANETQMMNIHYAIGSNLIDTLQPFTPWNLYECPTITYDYSLSGACPGAGIAKTNIAGINVYPNPVQNQLVISGQEQTYNVEVYTISGRLLGVFSTENNMLDVDFFENGTYYIRIIDSEGTVVAAERMVKMD